MIKSLEILKIENSEVKKGVDNAINNLGKIDIFVNNAGITGPNETTWNYPIDEWKKVIDVDLNGVFYCSKNITPHMIENNYGKIINISSIKHVQTQSLFFTCIGTVNFFVHGG